MFGPDPSRTKELSSVNAVMVLSVVLSQSNSPRQVIHLATTAVPSIVRSQTVKVWHPTESGEYYDRAPEGVDVQLADLSPAGGAVTVGEHPFGWAYPLTGPTDSERLFLVVAGDSTPTDEQRFLLTVLAQLCGTVIAKAKLYAAERAQAEQMAQLATRLESTVGTLTKVMDTHRQLNEVAASDRGEAGIAEVLHRLCGLPVVVQDAHGNVRAAAGSVAEAGPKESPEERKELIRVLANLRQAVYRRGAWMVLANPHIDVRGVIALLDPERAASEADLAALEYAATVLSMELARLRSIAEIELRTNRDFAEELLAGSDETAVKATAHVLGYDAQRPHRALIVTGARRTRISDGFLRAVNRQVRAFDVATLVVGRSDCVIVMAHQDANWPELVSAIDAELPKETCRLAVGSRYPNIWEIHHSYREAQFVADLSNSISGNFTDRVLSFEELGIYRILSSVGNLTEVERFMKEKLGPLIDYDNDHKSALVLTLARYFDCGCKYDETAERMNIHRSTLKYRLQRIRELTGYDLTDGSVRFDLHLATRIWLTLEALSGSTP
ncbi:MAG: helix-turn-helix domain-containing protein [Sporichthyaceae bacterium]